MPSCLESNSMALRSNPPPLPPVHGSCLEAREDEVRPAHTILEVFCAKHGDDHGVGDQLPPPGGLPLASGTCYAAANANGTHNTSMMASWEQPSSGAPWVGWVKLYVDQTIGIMGWGG